MFKSFRTWLAKAIVPESNYEEVSLDSSEHFGGQGGYRTGIEFSIKHVQNGYVISTKDNDVANSRLSKSVEAADIFKQYIVAEDDDLLPHIVAILAARKLK
jgi:hypothetical protein